ncbi:YjhX family toxin [Devosia sp.]|uniref:YjhX family toxin n=1 Tax=Devosia sp. TaxID=1871048 RepID=UPI002B002AA0|nr:YjhX family toxin [Devosia sp.]
MNISRPERRVLNALALGGRILLLRDDDARIIDIECYTREGWVMRDCSLDMFKRLRARKLVASSGGGPYRITRLGLEALRT